MQIGDHVVVTDPVGKQHNGLVTAVWGNDDDPTPTINVLYVSDDPNKHDSYGRQIDRDMTSTQHKSKTSAPGRFWQLPEEV